MTYEIPIASLQRSTIAPDVSISGVITLVWPYSASSQTLAIQLAAEDVALRKQYGQIRVVFNGPAARLVAQSEAGITDRLVLSLEGAQWNEDTLVRTPGRSVHGELSFARKLKLQVLTAIGKQTVIDIDEPKQADTTNTTLNTSTPVKQNVAKISQSVAHVGTTLNTYQSPAFVRTTHSSPIAMVDPFVDEEIDADIPRKRARISFGNVKNWHYAAKSPSPDDDEVDESTAIAQHISVLDSRPSPTGNGAMQPPQLPPLRMPVADKSTADGSGPITPRLHPVSAVSLPLPSPFPNESMQSNFDNVNLQKSAPATEQRVITNVLESETAQVAREQASHDLVASPTNPAAIHEHELLPTIDHLTSGKRPENPSMRRTLSSLFGFQPGAATQSSPETPPRAATMSAFDIAASPSLSIQPDADSDGREIALDERSTLSDHSLTKTIGDSDICLVIRSPTGSAEAGSSETATFSDLSLRITASDRTTSAASILPTARPQEVTPLIGEPSEEPLVLQDVPDQDEDVLEAEPPLAFRERQGLPRADSIPDSLLGLPRQVKLDPVRPNESTGVSEVAVRPLFVTAAKPSPQTRALFADPKHATASTMIGVEHQTKLHPLVDQMSKAGHESTSHKPSELTSTTGDSSDAPLPDRTTTADDDMDANPVVIPSRQEMIRRMQKRRSEIPTAMLKWSSPRQLEQPRNRHSLGNVGTSRLSLPRRSLDPMVLASMTEKGKKSDVHTPSVTPKEDTSISPPMRDNRPSITAAKTEQNQVRNTRAHNPEALVSTSTTSSTQGLRTAHGYFTRLVTLPKYINVVSQQSHPANRVDVLAVVTTTSKPPRRQTNRPKDYYTVFRVTDQSAGIAVSNQVEIYRPYKDSLPETKVGDVVLLRAFTVRARDHGQCLKSNDESAWCIWSSWTTDSAGQMTSKTDMRGPPLEYGTGETAEVSRLRAWYISTEEAPASTVRPQHLDDEHGPATHDVLHEHPSLINSPAS